MRWLPWILALWLMGCGGLSTQASKYLKQSEPFQQHLTQYQQQLKGVSQLPQPQRVQRTQELLSQVKTEHLQLQQLNPPASMAGVHRELEQLYATMEQFLQACLTGSGDTSDPKVRKLAGEWAQHLDQLQVELQKLESKH